MNPARDRRRPATFAAALLLTGSVLTAGSTLTTTPAAAADVGCAAAAAQSAQRDLNAVGDAAETHTGFAGVSLEAPCGPIRVFTGGPAAPDMTSAATGASHATSVVFTSVAHTLDEMTAVHEQILPEVERLIADGTDIRAAGPDMRTGFETVSVAGLTPRIRADVEAQLGPSVRVIPWTLGDLTLADAVVPVSPDAVAALPDPLSSGGDRGDDGTPFSGGDFTLHNTDATHVGLCSTAVGVHTASARFLLFAGHCSESGSGSSVTPTSGTAWVNAYIDGRHNLAGSATPFGTVTVNALASSDHLDAALIAVPPGASTDQFEYIGSSLNPTKAAIARSVIARSGNTICTDGAYEGQRCNATVQSTNYDTCIWITVDATRIRFCHTMVAQKPAGILVGQGDSGGPVYRDDDQAAGGLSMAGIITGEQPNRPCTTYTWRNEGTPDGDCSDTVIFTSLRPVLSTLGVTLNTVNHP